MVSPPLTPDTTAFPHLDLLLISTRAVVGASSESGMLSIGITETTASIFPAIRHEWEAWPASGF